MSALDDQHRQAADPYAVHHQQRTFDIRRVGAWSALFGSALYLCVFTIEGWLRPDYDAASMFISELSLGPWGWVQMANFTLFGLAILVFAMSVALEYGDARSARVGVTLLVIMGISMVASGPFVIDPVTDAALPMINPAAVAPHQMSFHSKFHYALGTLFFLLAPATCLCFAGFKRSRDPALRAFRRWSVGLGLASLAAVILLKLALLPPASNPLLPWRGLIQRATVIPFLVWLFIFGLVMLNHGRSTRAAVEPQ